MDEDSEDENNSDSDTYSDSDSDIEMSSLIPFIPLIFIKSLSKELKLKFG
jgi:hypothetical protein